jgi:hypothetical protein
VAFTASSKNRLTRHDLGRFPGESLFDRLGRAVCAAECLPRKELYEAWEVARRVRRRFRGGRVVDVAGGHGLLAAVMLLLDATSEAAWVVDPSPPASRQALLNALGGTWPRLALVRHTRQGLDAFAVDAGDVVVSCHACGALTDRVLDAAATAGARVAVLPCCHDCAPGASGALDGWMDTALAIDVQRVLALQRRGYTVWTQTIPASVTPKNRLLIGRPPTV